MRIPYNQSHPLNCWKMGADHFKLAFLKSKTERIANEVFQECYWSETRIGGLERAGHFTLGCILMIPVIGNVVGLIERALLNRPKDKVTSASPQIPNPVVPGFSPATLEIVRDLSAHLNTNDRLGTQGVFRVSPSSANRERLFQALRNRETVDLNDYSTECIASVIKQILREAEEPLLTNRLYRAFYDAERSVDAMRPLIDQLPRVNRQLLFEVLSLAAAVVSRESENLMSAQAMATVLQPGLLENRSDPLTQLTEQAAAQDVVEWMIQNQEQLRA